MNETSPEAQREKNVAECGELALRLIERGESFPFSKMNPEQQAKIEKSEGDTPAERAEYALYGILLADLLPRFEAEGMKILPPAPGCINFNVIPAVTGDASPDSVDTILVQHLEITDGMDPELVRLIELTRSIR